MKSREQSGVHFVLCDDDPIILEAFQEQLEAGRSPFGPHVQVTSCQTVAEALALPQDISPDVILIDLYICEERFAGIRILDTFASRYPTSKRIALTAHGNRLSDSELRRLAACRLNGFLDKHRGIDGTLTACHRIWQGETIFAPQFATLLADQKLLDEVPSKFLSPREQEVLTLRAQNIKIKDIALELGLSASSVSTILDRIEAKIGVKSSADLLVWHRQNGLDY